MRPILVVAGLAVAVALVTGMLLLRSVPAPGPGSAGIAPPAGTAAEPAAPPEEAGGSLALRRVAALEARLDELQGAVRRLDATLEALRAAGPGAGPSAEAAPDAAPGADAAEDPASSSAAATAAATADAEAARRREVSLQERTTRIVAALQLSPAERDRLLEIGRIHSAAVEELGKRARLALRPGAWGLTPEERESLRLLQEERKRVDGEGQAALLQFLGPERWQTFRRLEGEESEKERQVSRLVRPW